MTKEELRDLRAAHGLTQRALAEALGYHPNYISRLECGSEGITQRFERLVHMMFSQRKAKKASQAT